MLFYEKVKKRKASNRVANRAAQSSAQQRGSYANYETGRSAVGSNTNIQNCIQEELTRYFELLEGQPPSDLYRMVMSQVEHTLITYVMEECGNNQSRAAEYLGISRGTLRNKLTEQGLL